MGIRFSKDLVNWSALQVLDRAPTKWGQGNYTYPRFLDKIGSSNTEINPDEFYVYGKKVGNSGEFQGGYIIQSLKLSVIVPDASRYLAMQYFKELLNWEVDYNDSGVIWHANNIKVNGCKADVLNFSTAETFQGRKSSYSDIQFIRMLYRAILSREPEKAGINWFLNALRSGNSRDWLVDAIATSHEAQIACNIQKTIDPLIGDLNNDKKVDMYDSRIIANELFVGSSFYVPQSLIWHLGYYK